MTQWNLKDSDASETELYTPTTSSAIRPDNNAPVRPDNNAPVRPDNIAPVRRDNTAPVRRDNTDPILSLSISPSERSNPYWISWEFCGCIDVLAMTIALISFWPRAGSRSTLLPPRNILQSRNSTVTKFDTNILDSVCQGSHLLICEIPHLLRRLDLKDSCDNQEIESLGYQLGAMLHPTKIATNKEDCSYFPLLQLDINQRRNRTFGIQDSFNATLALYDEARSRVSKSHLDAARMLANADGDANGNILNTGDPIKREKAYRTSQEMLDLLGDYDQKLEIREGLSRRKLERQHKLQNDLKELEEQFEGLTVKSPAGNEIHVNPLCTASNMQRVERGLMDTMMGAAEDEAAAENLSNYYNAL